MFLQPVTYKVKIYLELNRMNKQLQVTNDGMQTIQLEPTKSISNHKQEKKQLSLELAFIQAEQKCKCNTTDNKQAPRIPQTLWPLSNFIDTLKLY